MVGEKTVEREVSVSVTLCVGIAGLALCKFCAEQQRSPSQAPPTEEELAEWLGTVLEGKANRDQVLQAFSDKHCLTSRQTTGAVFHQVCLPTADGKFRPAHLAKALRIEFRKGNGSITVTYPAHRACNACLEDLEGTTRGLLEWHKPDAAVLMEDKRRDDKLVSKHVGGMRKKARRVEECGGAIAFTMASSSGRAMSYPGPQAK